MATWCSCGDACGDDAASFEIETQRPLPPSISEGSVDITTAQALSFARQLIHEQKSSYYMPPDEGEEMIYCCVERHRGEHVTAFHLHREEFVRRGGGGRAWVSAGRRAHEPQRCHACSGCRALPSAAGRSAHVGQQAHPAQALDLAVAAPNIGCEMQLLAKDGIYLADAPRQISQARVPAGGRADVMVRCSTAGSYRPSTQGMILGAGTSIAGSCAGSPSRGGRAWK